MLNRLRHWRPNRLPSLLLHFRSRPLPKPSSSAAALISDDLPSVAEKISPSETICRLRNYGTHQFLRSNCFRGRVESSLDVETVDQIIHKLGDDSPELGLEFFYALKNDYGFQHSRVSVFVVAHILAEKRRIKQLQELLMSLIEAEGAGTVSSLCALLENGFKDRDSRSLVWDMLAFCYSRREMLRDALFVLANMKDLNLHPTIYTYNCMLHNLKHTTFVWDVYDEIKVRGVLQNEYTNAIVIDCLCRHSMIQEAIEFWRQTDMKENVASIVSFNTLISGFCKLGLIDVAKSFFCLMLKHGLLPDTYSYNILIHGLCMAGSLEEALGFTVDMEKHGIEPDIVTYNTLIKGFLLLGFVGGAEQVIQKVILNDLNPNVVTYKLLLCCYYQTVSTEAMFRLLNKMSCVDIVLYNIIMNGYVKIGRCGDAVQLYKQIMEKGISPSIVTFNSLMYGFCKDGKLAVARRWLVTIKKHGIAPNVVTYTTLMDGYSRDGNTRAMLELLREMKVENVNPTHVTYTVLIKGLCRQRRWQESFQVLAYMYVKGLNPDQVTYNTIIQCLCEVGNVKRAFKLRDEMLLQNLQPSPVTYNILLDGLCRHGALRDADKLLHLLQDQHIALTKVAYTTLIKAHCVKGDISIAILTFHWMMQKGFEISIKDFNAVISRLCKRGFLTEAKLFLSLMLSRGMSPDMELYELLNWVFSKYGS